MKKFLIMLPVCFILIALIVNTSALAEPKDDLTIPVPKPTQAEYEYARNVLYDAALDLCVFASDGAWVWDNCVDNETKRIIREYRVPSLEVLLHAIEEMDYDGCLCDSFDEPLIKFEEAKKRYDEITEKIFKSCEKK